MHEEQSVLYTYDIHRENISMISGMVQSVFTEVRGEEGERRRRYTDWYPSGMDDRCKWDRKGIVHKL